MAPSKITQTHEIPIPASRLWAATKDSQLVAKAVKPVVTKVEDVQGGGSTPAIGDIRIVHFNTEIVPFPFLKEKLTVLDEEKMTIGSTVLEGGLLGTQLSSQTATISLKPNGDGCTATWVLEYESIVENPDVDKLVESFVKSLKAIEAYLLSSTDYS